MSCDNGSSAGDGTGKTEMQEMILDVLREIRDRIGELEERNIGLESLVNQLTADVHTVHECQKTFGERLSSVERFCVERPLRSSRPPPAPLREP